MRTPDGVAVITGDEGVVDSRVGLGFVRGSHRDRVLNASLEDAHAFLCFFASSYTGARPWVTNGFVFVGGFSRASRQLQFCGGAPHPSLGANRETQGPIGKLRTEPRSQQAIKIKNRGVLFFIFILW